MNQNALVPLYALCAVVGIVGSCLLGETPCYCWYHTCKAKFQMHIFNLGELGYGKKRMGKTSRSR
jgi:hypothetical protein